MSEHPLADGELRGYAVLCVLGMGGPMFTGVWLTPGPNKGSQIDTEQIGWMRSVYEEAVEDCRRHRLIRKVAGGE